MSKPKITFREFKPAAIVCAACLAVFGYCISLYQDHSKEIWEKDERTRLSKILNNKRSNLESELYARIYYTRSVAAYVSLHPELPDEEYDNLAEELVKQDPVINTMSLAPNGIIRALYPRTGHEAALGLNLLDHPERKRIVEKTIETRRTFVAGPVPLIEGGIAFISYTPIFDKTLPDEPFWGMTDIVIRRDELFEAANIKEKESDAQFAIRGYDGKGTDGAVFYGDPDVFTQDPVTTTVQLPDGEWIIAAIPAEGWASYYDQDNILLTVLIVSGSIIAVLIGLFAGAIIRIKANARQFNSIFNAMTSTVIELDNDGVITWIAPTKRVIAEPLKSLKVGDTFQAVEISGGEPRFEKALRSTIDDQTFNQIEIKFGTKASEAWAMGNLSPKGPHGATLVLYDITKQREQQAQIQASEESLRQLNHDKDLLFSIIAHDLRSPSSSVVNLSEELLQARDTLSVKEQNESIEFIYRSATENLFLLENLLNWAQSQQGGLSVQKTEIALQETAGSVIGTFSEIAALKGIRIQNDIPPASISFDEGMFETILRNLLSNAVKFSHKGGTITIGMQPLHKSPSLEIFIRDEGVGMAPERIQELTASDSRKSTQGTAQESGTGLGLPLCRRFVEFNGGRLRIESTPGVGTTVFFTAERFISDNM